MQIERQPLTRGQTTAIALVLVLAAVMVWRLGPEPTPSLESATTSPAAAATGSDAAGWSIVPRGEAGLREGVLWESGDGTPLLTPGPLLLRPEPNARSARCLITRWPDDSDFAFLHLSGTAADRGTLELQFVERDPTGRETWQVAIPVEPGRNRLQLRLQAEPEGDLRAADRAGDGAWNPYDQPLELRITFTGGLFDVGTLELARR